MSSGPEIHPEQAKEYDPPSAPTGILLFVGTAILVVIVFALEVMHAQFMASEAAVLDERPATPAARLQDEQVKALEAGQVPSPPPPEPRKDWVKGKSIDAAMDEVVQKYGRGS